MRIEACRRVAASPVAGPRSVQRSRCWFPDGSTFEAGYRPDISVLIDLRLSGTTFGLSEDVPFEPLVSRPRRGGPGSDTAAANVAVDVPGTAKFVPAAPVSVASTGVTTAPGRVTVAPEGLVRAGVVSRPHRDAGRGRAGDPVLARRAVGGSAQLVTSDVSALDLDPDTLYRVDVYGLSDDVAVYAVGVFAPA
jgi:hypothetical protein